MFYVQLLGPRSVRFAGAIRNRVCLRVYVQCMALFSKVPRLCYVQLLMCSMCSCSACVLCSLQPQYELGSVAFVYVHVSSFCSDKLQRCRMYDSRFFLALLFGLCPISSHTPRFARFACFAHQVVRLALYIYIYVQTTKHLSVSGSVRGLVVPY